MLLGEPYTRQLHGKLRELRFYLGTEAVRVTYWIAPGKRFILLTVFHETRMREVERARRALRLCVAEAHMVDAGEGRGRWVAGPTGVSCGNAAWASPAPSRPTPLLAWPTSWDVPSAPCVRSVGGARGSCRGSGDDAVRRGQV
ncbi:type II toxin-antitoxin system RelE/ParE family toxin [Actinomadura terrae]|uniref:type II toxin-antitoxin system RelE/ParE family toxin n=1 Tax=Actinomadura terrae TaxID=604353 RepID=UPI0027E0C545|nr:type II toxin-antitoxin system RelE/ParE family toxin [Actinomadura terrae]